jgi:hypothetical protein
MLRLLGTNQLLPTEPALEEYSDGCMVTLVTTVQQAVLYLEFSRKRMQLLYVMMRTVYVQSCENNAGKVQLYRTQFPHTLFALLNASTL